MTTIEDRTRTEYKLWLVPGEAGQVCLTGWSETIKVAAPHSPAQLDHWPIYPLCDDRATLPQRLAELGLDLAAGFTIGDLNKQWDVYVRHPDIAALRDRLNRERAPRAT